MGKDLSDLDLRSRLLVEYSQLLFRDDQLWEIAPDYLSVASELNDGGQILDRLVAKVNWRKDTSMAERLLTICDRFELKIAREDILRSLTLKYDGLFFKINFMLNVFRFDVFLGSVARESGLVRLAGHFA